MVLLLHVAFSLIVYVWYSRLSSLQMLNDGYQAEDQPLRTKEDSKKRKPARGA